MRLGKLIVGARERKGLSQRGLARKTGLSHPQISLIEAGKVMDPGFKTIVRIADVLGIRVERAAQTVRPRARKSGRLV